MRIAMQQSADLSNLNLTLGSTCLRLQPADGRHGQEDHQRHHQQAQRTE
jgi:hypothetical protein